MIRTLLFPIAAAALLAGCVTGDYAHRGPQGSGDYYYGRPSVDYRYHDPYGYGPYGPGYGYYGRTRFHGSLHYGYPFYGRAGFGHPYYGHPYYRNPYYGYPYRPPVIVQPRPDDGQPRVDRGDRPPPWRDINARRRMDGPSPGGIDSIRTPEPARPVREVRREGGSRMEQIMRSGRESPNRPVSSEVEP